MAARRLVEPEVDRKYTWLRTATIGIGVLSMCGSVVAAFLAFQYNLLLGWIVTIGGLLILFLVLAMIGATRVFLSIEENVRRANTMSPYTMQTTHNLTAIHDVVEEMTVNMHNAATRMNHLKQDLHDVAEKLDAIALYSRTTAILIHQQQNHTNGSHDETSFQAQPHTDSDYSTTAIQPYMSVAHNGQHSSPAVSQSHTPVADETAPVSAQATIAETPPEEAEPTPTAPDTENPAHDTSGQSTIIETTPDDSDEAQATNPSRRKLNLRRLSSRKHHIAPDDDDDDDQPEPFDYREVNS